MTQAIEASLREAQRAAAKQTIAPQPSMDAERFQFPASRFQEYVPAAIPTPAPGPQLTTNDESMLLAYASQARAGAHDHPAFQELQTSARAVQPHLEHVLQHHQHKTETLRGMMDGMKEAVKLYNRLLEQELEMQRSVVPPTANAIAINTQPLDSAMTTQSNAQTQSSAPEQYMMTGNIAQPMLPVQPQAPPLTSVHNDLAQLESNQDSGHMQSYDIDSESRHSLPTAETATSISFPSVPKNEPVGAVRHVSESHAPSHTREAMLIEL